MDGQRSAPVHILPPIMEADRRVLEDYLPFGKTPIFRFHVCLKGGGWFIPVLVGFYSSHHSPTGAGFDSIFALVTFQSTTHLRWPFKHEFPFGGVMFKRDTHAG